MQGTSIPRSLFVFAVLYGGMVPLGGVLGTKQVGIGPLAVEAGIFPFLTLVALSSAIAELHGRDVANRLVRYGFIPLIVAIALTVLVLQLPTDPGMYEPAKEAFPIVLGQGWRLMGAGIIAYGCRSRSTSGFSTGCAARWARWRVFAGSSRRRFRRSSTH